MERDAPSQALSDLADCSLRGPGRSIDLDLYRFIQPGVRSGERVSSRCVRICAPMGNQSVGCSSDGSIGESLARLPLYDADLHRDVAVDSEQYLRGKRH